MNELHEFLACYPADVQATFLVSWDTLRARYQPVVEWIFDATTAVCAGISYGPKQRDVFVNLAAYPKHVTLVFAHGASLDDPEKRLKGEGNQVRHIRMAGPELLDDPYVAALIDQASASATRPEGPVVPEVKIKVYEGPKRRPA